MYRYVVGAAAALALSVGAGAAASAADLSVPPPTPVYTKAPAVVAPAPNWTGWYVGLNAGGDWGTSNGSTSQFCNLVAFAAGGGCFGTDVSTPINAVGASQRFNTSGFTGGIQGGYNWQSGSWLVGFEADFDAFRSRGSTTASGLVTLGGAAGSMLSINSSLTTDWLFTARPRVGWVTGNWLFYGTGGLAVADLRGNWSFLDVTGVGNITESASGSATKAGWVVGAGFETMISGRWTLGLEYLYTKFNGVSAIGLVNTPAGAPPSGNTFPHSTDLSDNILRVRLNYKFGDPVVARY